MASKEARPALGWLVSALTVLALSQAPACAEVTRQDNPQIEGLNETRVYEWRDTSRKPNAVAIAVHGLVLHGRVYDVLARELAAQGFVVVAPDLRGYGTRCPEHLREHSSEGFADTDHNISYSISEGGASSVQSSDDTLEGGVCCNSMVGTSKISYDKSYKELQELVRAVRNQYPALPLYVIGESLGAGMALHLAADMPQSIDGLVLSSPAIKRRFYLEPRMLMDVMVLMARPSKNIDLAPYIKRFASEDPMIIDAALKDPLVRRKLTPIDLWKTARLIKGNVSHAARVPDSMPVLIIQGDKDRMLRSNGVVTLLEHLKSRDQTVKWFPGKGHLLLETPHIMPETISTVSSWLTEHARDANPAKASIRESDELNN
ncbi:MAG: lysophospholipase [Candidatus Obscuribacterales bacterium]|nr:lysophospholipase [Candidatus Obscuribacterales bacterium]